MIHLGKKLLALVWSAKRSTGDEEGIAVGSKDEYVPACVLDYLNLAPRHLPLERADLRENTIFGHIQSALICFATNDYQYDHHAEGTNHPYESNCSVVQCERP